MSDRYLAVWIDDDDEDDLIIVAVTNPGLEAIYLLLASGANSKVTIFPTGKNWTIKYRLATDEEIANR